MHRSRGTTLAVTLAAMGLLTTAGVASAANPPPIDASTYHIRCNTMIGTIKLNPPLVNGGLGPMDMKVKAKLDGCSVVDASNNAVAITIAGQIKGTITLPSADCANLLGAQPATGTLTAKWKSTPALLDNSSVLNLSTVTGNAIAVVTGAYGTFDISSTVTGSFAGPGTGPLVTSEDLGVILSRCQSGNKGLTIGIGQLDLGN